MLAIAFLAWMTLRLIAKFALVLMIVVSRPQTGAMARRAASIFIFPSARRPTQAGPKSGPSLRTTIALIATGLAR
jgi:hypothetical protein